MADFYYRYNNKGIEGSKTVLLNDAYLGSTVPFASNLHRRFRAEDFNATTKVWTDSASGTSITADSTGTISLVSHTGDKKYRTTNVVQFDTASGITFNNDQLATYTLFSIARYINSNAERILQGSTGDNWLTGHHLGFAGQAFHFNSFSPTLYSYGTNFFISTDISTQYFTNGLSNGTLSPSSSYLPRLGINQGALYKSQSSDGQILDILMYNRELNDLERKKVEHYLASYYGILDISGNLTANYNRTPLTSETSLLVSTVESPNWVVYPPFYTEQTGMSFALWFKSNGTGVWGRLIDFSNGPSANNIIIGIVGQNLSISAYGASRQCELADAYSNCNDNIWRHLVWTISPDGLTWKVYINRVLYATITSSNYTNYGSSSNIPPSHPPTGLRSYNFIGKSAWDHDPLFVGSIDDVQCYNSTLDQTMINQTWNIDSSLNLIPKYYRTPLTSEIFMLVSTTANPNFITYPAFYIGDTATSTVYGFSVSMWFSSATPDQSRLFDFATGDKLNFVRAAIVGNNLRLSVKNDTTECNLLNVFPNCNDNVRRHFAWTISPDGSTWRVYINFVLYATITSSNHTNYNSTGSGPIHPSNGLRNLNYIGKSNTDAESAIWNGTMDEFRLYNRTIGPETINYPWFINSTTPVSISYNRAKTATEYPLLVSNSDNYINYPSFYISQTGLSFSMWFRANSTGNSSRLFDFGAGRESDNIFAFFYNGNIGIGAYPTGPNTANLNQFQVQNAATGCNDNVWRHFVWTISPDGLTWKIYINRVLRSTITPSTAASYGIPSGVTVLAPFHPRSVFRTSNFIGKSNWSNDPLFIGAIDDFQMYNYTLDQNAINKPSLSHRYLRDRLPTETSMLVSSTSNPNYLSYPSFNTVQTGMTFAFWFKSNSNPNWYRLFDFGNSPTGVNIGVFTYGLNIGIFVNGIGFYNVVPNCNDNIWRHLTWTISADGLTYIFYLNKTVVTTINSSTTGTNSYTNPTFGTFFSNPPQHPATGIRSSNYLFMSNQLNEKTAYLNASMHAFQMWNTPLDQTAINALYTETAFAGTYTLSQFPDIQKVYGSEPFLLSNPVSTGSGSFTFTSSNTSVATIENNLVTIVGVGTSTITALQWTETITATLTVAQPTYASSDAIQPTNTNYLVTMKGKAYDVNQAILRNIQQTVNLKQTLQSLETIGFGSTVNVYKKNIVCTMNGVSQLGDTLVSFGKAKKPMWVMGGTTTHTLAYSYDGINWNGLGTSILTSVIGIAWNGTLWVAVGTKTSVPNIAYSYDGFTWTSKPLPMFSSNIHDVAWNGKMFVVVGSGTNGIGYSYNGIDWYAATSISTTFTYGRDIGWNGRMWVAVGSSTNKIVYSYDGIQWFPNTTTVLDAGYGITYDGKKWIAVGTGTTNFIVDSVDGITWTGRGKANFTSECHGVASNGIVTVVIGRGGGNLAYSYGNNVWTTVSMPTLTYAQRIKWNGTMFVAISWSTVSIFYSYNGIQWNSVDSSDMTFCNCVAHNNPLENQIVFKERTYVAGGQGTNTLAYSFDGITWRGLGATIFDSFCRGVTFGNLWVAVGTFNNTIAYSYDGINWTGLGRSAITSSGACAAYNGSMWLVGGSGTKKLASSTTGTSFTGIDISFSDACHGLAWNGNLWVAVGYFTPTMAWSTNGTSWTTVVNPPITYAGMSVVWNGFMFVACGDGTNSLCWSIDGKTWIAGTTSTGESTSMLSYRFYSAAYNGKMWLAGGAGEKKLAYSYDGKLWIPIYNLPFSSGIYRVLWDKQKWVAGGQGTNTLGYSYDGFSWVSLGSASFTSVNWMDYDAVEPDTYIYMARPTVALGGNGTDTKSIVFSSDGFTWTQAVTPTLSQGLCAAYNGSLWVAGGIGTYTMAYSTNGIHWSPVLSSKSIFSTEVHGIAYNGTLWIAGGYGTNTLAYSYDGLSWVPISNTLTRVFGLVWNGTLFMAAGTGTNTVAYSYNGINWLYASCPIESIYAIAYSGSMWIASGLGTNDSLAYSYDGINWTGLGKRIFASSNAIAHNGFMWVAGGSSTNTLAYSYDGFSWTGLGTSIFTLFGYAVTWNGNKWIATGSGTNSIAYSVDGKTWIGLGTTDLIIGFGVASHTDTKVVDASITTDSLSFSVDVAQSGYRNLAIGVKGTMY
jgi:hypothetical protein